MGEVMTKLEGDYGAVDSRESIMKKFYSCTQKPEETIEIYSSRLEDIFDKAVRLDALRRTDTPLLKEVFHAGLKMDLKIMTLFQKTSIPRYEDLKKELRKLEADLKPDDPDTKKTCKAAIPPDRESKSEMSEMKQTIKQLHERIDTLEKEKEQSRYPYFPRGQGFRGRGQMGGRGYGPPTPSRGRGYETTPPSRGRGDYRPSRPLGRRTFEPTCYYCGEKGHIQRNCPTVNQVICYNCQEPGHISRNCPNA